MDDLNFYENQKKEIEQKLHDAQYKADLKKFATDVRGIYEALTNAGFTDDQAWQITGYLVSKTIDKQLS